MPIATGSLWNSDCDVEKRLKKLDFEQGAGINKIFGFRVFDDIFAGLVIIGVRCVCGDFMAIDDQLEAGLEPDLFDRSGCLKGQKHHSPVQFGLAHEVLAVSAAAAGANLVDFVLGISAIKAGVVSFGTFHAFHLGFDPVFIAFCKRHA